LLTDIEAAEDAMDGGGRLFGISLRAIA
jgi:hypothetical protein